LTGRLLSGVAALGAEPNRAAPTPAVSAEEVTDYLSDLAESLRMMDELVATGELHEHADELVGQEARGRLHAASRHGNDIRWCVVEPGRRTGKPASGYTGNYRRGNVRARSIPIPETAPDCPQALLTEHALGAGPTGLRHAKSVLVPIHARDAWESAADKDIAWLHGSYGRSIDPHIPNLRRRLLPTTREQLTP